MKDTLGGKGAGLAEMTNAGLPVPPGFTISTDACNLYYELGQKLTPAIEAEIVDNLRKLEKAAGATLGLADESAARLGPLGREVLDARDDGHDPQPRPERHDGRRAEGADRRTAASRSTATAASSRCSAPSCSRFRRTRSSTSSRRSRTRARRDARHRSRRGQRCARSSTRYKDVVRERDEEGRSRRIRPSSCAWRATPCSARGTTRAPRNTAASTTSPTRSAPPSTCR